MAMSDTLAVSLIGYYQWRNAQHSARVLQAKEIKVKIAKVYAASCGTYGSLRMTVALNGQGKKLGSQPA